MVVEEFFKARWVERRPIYSLFIGIFITLISFFTSYLLFKNTPSFIGISTILFTVILVVPLVNKLFDIEERIEVKERLSFFKKHEHIIDFFIYFFIGVFIVLFEIAIISQQFVVSQEQIYNIKPVIEESKGLPPPPTIGSESDEVIRLFRNNIYVMLISFILSLFYGAGALFLITLNASIFASALVKVIKANLPNIGLLSTYSFTLCNLGIMFFHMIPEVSGYLLSAIAGGVLSHAFLRERLGSKNFKIVLKDSIILLVIAVAVIFIAAVIESKISKKLFYSNVCFESTYIIITILFLISAIFVAFEILRKKKYFH